MASYQTLGAQPVYNPVIPYVAELQGGCHPGMIFTFNGTNPAKTDGFVVNFATGMCEGCDIAFHFNPRLSSKIVCNTFKDGKWVKEEKISEMPFKKSKDFKLVVEVTKYTFQVAVDDKFVVDYKHQVTLDRVQWLQIQGQVMIKSIVVTGGHAPGAAKAYGL